MGLVVSESTQDLVEIYIRYLLQYQIFESKWNRMEAAKLKGTGYKTWRIWMLGQRNRFSHMIWSSTIFIVMWVNSHIFLRLYFFPLFWKYIEIYTYTAARQIVAHAGVTWKFHCESWTVQKYVFFFSSIFFQAFLHFLYFRCHWTGAIITNTKSALQEHVQCADAAYLVQIVRELSPHLSYP